MNRSLEPLRRAGKEELLIGRWARVWAAAPAGPLCMHLRKPIQQEVIQFVHRVFLFPNSHGPRVVAFASARGNESSELCFQAGQVLALQGSGSVCLVDANLRAPLLHKLFEANISPGLVDATVTPGPIKDFARPIAGGNLWLVPPGSHAEGAPPLFAADRLRTRMQELREGFDYVLIDAPPVSSSPEAVQVGQVADGVILVVQANSTRREAARTAKETLEGANVKLLGAILTNRTFPIPEALYRKF